MPHKLKQPSQNSGHNSGLPFPSKKSGIRESGKRDYSLPSVELYATVAGEDFILYVVLLGVTVIKVEDGDISVLKIDCVFAVGGSTVVSFMQ